MYRSHVGPAIKRVVDLGIAAAGLGIVLPILAGCAVAIRLTSPGPVLFRQERVGRGGRPFTVLKLRTMHHGASDAAHRAQTVLELAGAGDTGGSVAFKAADDPRITTVGRWMRRLSLDELPQLINVIRGDMSLVGPRPSLPYEVDLFPAWAAARLDVRPGLTGLWQVSGRNEISLIEMLELDCKYARSWSVAGDLAILARTVPVVVAAQGAA